MTTACVAFSAREHAQPGITIAYRAAGANVERTLAATTNTKVAACIEARIRSSHRDHAFANGELPQQHIATVDGAACADVHPALAGFAHAPEKTCSNSRPDAARHRRSTRYRAIGSPADIAALKG